MAGNASDKKLFRERLKELKQQIQNGEHTYFVADSALYTRETLRTISESMKWITRVPANLARISHQHSSRFGQTVLPGDKERPEGRVKLTLPRGYLKSDGETDGQSGRTVGEKCGLGRPGSSTL